MGEEQNPDSKVRIRTRDGDSEESETLWATSLGDDRYRLDNLPFFAYDVSWQDVVYAPWPEGSAFPEFDRVVERSGNRTIRVIFDHDLGTDGPADAVSRQLTDLGCNYEGINPHYIAYNIPPGVDLQRVIEILQGKPLIWEHGDPSYDTLYGGAPLPPPVQSMAIKPKSKLKGTIKRLFGR